MRVLFRGGRRDALLLTELLRCTLSGDVDEAMLDFVSWGVCAWWAGGGGGITSAMFAAAEGDVGKD